MNDSRPVDSYARRALADHANRSATLAFFRQYQLPYPKRGEWRIPGDGVPLYGSIANVPRSQGRIAVTDGILCYIVRDDGSLFVGHLQWWEGLNGEGCAEGPRGARSKGVARETKTQRLMKEYR